jgi:transposase-like protein
MLQRGGEVVIRMLENVKQVTIGPLIKRTIAEGSTVYTDEYDIYGRLAEWGYGHETVCHAAGEYARDDDGDGFCEVHVNTLEGFWSLLRSWLRPHRGIPQESLPLYLGFFEFVHNVRARGRRLLGALIGQLLTLVANSIPCSRGRLQCGEARAAGPRQRRPRPPLTQPHQIDRRRRQEVLQMRLRLTDIAAPP